MVAIGIDVSKFKSTVAIIKDGVLFQKPFDIFHTPDGFTFFQEKLSSIDKSDIKIVMEATGIYHFPLALKLIESGYFVCIENAFLLKKYFDVYLRKNKNDKVDSIKIATYCFEKWHSLNQFSLQSETYQDLLFLSRQYEQFTVLKSKSKIQLTNLLDITFPNFNSCFNEDSKQFNLFLDILQEFYHPSLISMHTFSSFSAIISELAKKRGVRSSTSARISNYLYSLSQNTLSARPLNSSTKLAIHTCIDTIRELEKATEDILSQMNEFASTLPEFSVVNSMTGVGRKTCARLIAEIGDVRRFNNANSLIAYAGIDIPQYQSGNFCASERHITKRR